MFFLFAAVRAVAVAAASEASFALSQEVLGRLVKFFS
jgi:hypothetical protein